MNTSKKMDTPSSSFTSIPCQIIRLGSYVMNPAEPILFSNGLFVIKSSILGEDGKASGQWTELTLPMVQIVKVDVFIGKIFAMMFISVTPECGRQVRFRLRMREPRAWFEPESERNEFRMISILLRPPPDEFRRKMNEAFGGIYEESAISGGFQKLRLYLPPELRAKLEQLLKKSELDCFIQRMGLNSSAIVPLFTWPDGADRFVLTSKDYKCLNPEEKINDSVIDFYLRYLCTTIGDSCRMHVFSSFFYTRLISVLGHEHPVTLNAAERHCRVKEWTQHVNIFDKDYVFVPINENCHWYLIVICFPGFHGSSSDPDSVLITAESSCQFIVEDEELADEPVKRSCFLIFDSLSVGCSNFTLHSGYRVVQALHDYLRIEFQAKRPDQVSTNPFNRIATRVQILRVPQQNNAIDCGVFLLKYAECFMKNPLTGYRLPVKNLSNWFPWNFATEKRKEIQDLLLELTRQLRSPREADALIWFVKESPNSTQSHSILKME